MKKDRWQISTDLATHADQILSLDSMAMRHVEPYLFRDADQADAIRRFLLESGFSELATPDSRVLLQDGDLVGWFAGARQALVVQNRLASALALHRSRFFLEDADLLARLRMGSRALCDIGKKDFYLSRIAVVRGYRRQGAARFLLQALKEVAREASCDRILAEVHAMNCASRKMLESESFRRTDSSWVGDPGSAVEHEILHMAFCLRD